MANSDSYSLQSVYTSSAELNIVHRVDPIDLDDRFKPERPRNPDPDKGPYPDAENFSKQDKLLDDAAYKKKIKDDLANLYDSKIKRAEDIDWASKKLAYAAAAVAIAGAATKIEPILAIGAGLGLLSADLADRAEGAKREYTAKRDKAKADPIVFDLDGDGIDLNPIASRHIMLDVDEDGYAETVVGVHADDGILIHDADGNGAVSNFGEMTFVDGGGAGPTDLHRLAAFDSDNNGIFNSVDARFGDFLYGAI